MDAPVQTGGYCRLFPELPELEVAPSPLHALGLEGAICDRGDAQGMEARTEAGRPFFGQLIAHDVTADGRRADGSGTRLPPPSRAPGTSLHDAA